eukprot:CAMPEP_0176049970 /NCGR_PEP_ID=MMETSP0120_2-20121206/24834_1 /TAXON_ID=160619 /ORGANISM="Kryptoperidinium foliaceum, Strain CCMP 1326" /LENGTH=215 /DNA_ID=CAMNT_0017383401 /DNA_START=1 /DNA_END=648 /DNA_ORIENTATION=+
MALAGAGVAGADNAAPPDVGGQTDPVDAAKSADEQDRIASARQALAELQALLSNRGMIEPTRPGPAEILPHLLLGGEVDAKNVEALLRLGVTHVLNVAGGEVKTGPEAYEQRGIRYTEFVSEDTQAYDIMQHYDEVAQLADEVAASNPPGRLLVHCFAGVNRSGTLCLAYHLVRSGMPLLQSAKHCKAARGRICTNVGFQLQLFRFALERSLPLR